MKKELFITTTSEAQEAVEKNEILAKLSPYVWYFVNRQFPKKHEIEREDIVNSVLFKVWRSEYCTKEGMNYVYAALPTIVKYYTIDQNRSEKKHSSTYAFSCFEWEKEGADDDKVVEFADENALSYGKFRFI